MSRLIYVILCLFLLAWYASAQTYTVENKVPKFTVANKVQVKDTYGCRCTFNGGVCQCAAGECRDSLCPTAANGQVVVCQNGTCSVVSSSQTTILPRAREGWRPGKFLGLRK